MEGEEHRSPKVVMRWVATNKGVEPMRIDVYHHIVPSNEVNHKLDKILAVLSAIKQEEGIMSQALDDLAAAVAENTALDQSAIDLIGGLAAQIEALKDDPVALAALAAEVRAKSAALAAAIQANTPQA
jgi:hypothetical protein